MSVTLAVNGRFLRSAQPTGMHRVARSLVGATRQRGVPVEVMVPPGVRDPMADRTVWGPPGRFGDHLWEQALLPRAVRGRPLLSLLNTAPVAPHNAAVMVHDLAFRVGPQWYSRSIRLYGAMVMAAARRARVVLTVSESVASELVQAGIGMQHITVVRNAVADDMRPATAEVLAEVRARHRLERPFLLLVGWSNPRKDAMTVVRAHLRLSDRIEHDLVLTGADSPTFRSVDLPEGQSIRHLGYVSDLDLVALMTAADAFVYPALYEGFGLPPLEAMRCGTPAIVSDLPVLHESTGEQATFVPVGDVEQWERAMESALRGELVATPGPAWSWSDAADVMIQALRPLL